MIIFSYVKLSSIIILLRRGKGMSSESLCYEELFRLCLLLLSSYTSFLSLKFKKKLFSLFDNCFFLITD